jgi:hypothetical protein
MSVPKEAVKVVPDRARPVPTKSVMRSPPKYREVPVALRKDRRWIVEEAEAVMALKAAVPVKVGEPAKTRAPVPVSSVTAVIKLADDGVARKLATPAARPEIPVLTGRPVALVKVPEDGVPSAPPLTTNAPAVPTLTPRAVRTPVPAPVKPVAIGRPVALVRTAAEGVPRLGVVKAGEVAKTRAPEPVSSVMEEVR